MKQQPAVLVLNTGGTFNKRYDPLRGELFVPEDDLAVETLLAEFRGNLAYRVLGLLYKDSLAMTDADREYLAHQINAATERHVLVIHGTDTLSLSAAHFAKMCPDRRIVLTGAMVPHAFEPREAALNFALGMGYLLAGDAPGVFIAMHGLVLPHAQMAKDRQNGVFRAVTKF